MTHRERVRTAMSRRQPDRVPWSVEFTPAVLERFRQETGAEDPAEYWDFEVRGVGPKAAELLPDFGPYHPEGIPEKAAVTEYGSVLVPGDFYHFWRYQYPLDHETTLADLEAYPWPDYTARERCEQPPGGTSHQRRADDRLPLRTAASHGFLRASVAVREQAVEDGAPAAGHL